MLSNNKDWFYKDTYFHRWHRVLVRGGGDHYPQQISIPLTALNFDSKSDWTEASQIKVLRKEMRYSAFKDSGTWTHHLPDDVYTMMVENMGKAKADFMVHADILPLVDWDIWARHDNGGCFLDVCQKKFAWTFIKNKVDHEGTNSSFITKDNFLYYMERVPVIGEEPIGGFILEAPNSDLRFIINYDITHDLVVAEFNYSHDGSEHISRFAKRFSGCWDEELIKSLHPLLIAADINTVTRATIVQVTNSAAVGMSLIKSNGVPESLHVGVC